MKKILFLILFISILMVPVGVRGFDFTLDWRLSGTFVRVEGDEIYDLEMVVLDEMLDRSADNVFYRMSPNTSIPSTTEYIAYEGDLRGYNKLSEEQKREIELLTFFGYNYSSRAATKWYAITQTLIWRVIYGNDKVYFIDKIGGNKIDKYTQEIEALYTAIDDFRENGLKYEHEEYEVFSNDSLVLDNIGSYEVYKSDYEYKLANDTLTVDNVRNEGKIYLGKMDNRYKYRVSIFSYADGNEVIRKGNFYYDVKMVDVKIKKGTINFSIDVIEDAYSIDDKIDNTCYILMDSKKEIDKVCFKDDMKSYSFTNLEIGRYYLKPVSMGDGYYNWEEKAIELTKDKLVENVKIMIPLIKNKIEVHKRYLDNEILVNEESSFEVYDRNNNLVGILKTDETGYGEIELGYGKYKLVQIKGKDGYELVDDTWVNIRDTVTSHKLELTSKIGDNINNNEYIIPDTGMELSSKINFKMLLSLAVGITCFFIKRYR